MKTRFHRLTGRFLGGLLCLLLALLGSSPVLAEKSVTVTFYHTDVLGSVIATSDEFGHLQWRRDYQPYGEIQLPRDSNDTDTRTNSLGYTGKPRDPNGLVYLGARYYDPLAGRFMAVDPAGIDAGNPHSFNRYAYAHNNPYKYIDPDGANAVTAFGGLLTESYNWFSGGGFNGAAVWGALKDGYNGEGAGMLGSAVEDAMSFGGGALLGAAGKLYRLVKASRVTKGLADPKAIRFTQDSIKSTFKDGRSLRGLIDDLKSGKVTADDLPAIRTFERDGKLYSLDNRRLKAFQEAGVPIRTRPATADEIANEAFKFTSKNDGASIRVRGGGL